MENVTSVRVWGFIVAVGFVVLVPSAQAITTDELQAQIAALLAQIASLQQVASQTSQPSITVLSPNGGEVWARGSVHSIQWTPSISNMNLGIALMEANATVDTTYAVAHLKYCRGDNLTSLQDWSWIVGYDAEGRQQDLAGSYRILVQDCGRNVRNISAPFTITSSGNVTSTTSLTVGISPNTAPARTVVMGSTNNSLATFRFSNRTDDAINFQRITIFADASGAVTGTLPAGFTDVTLYNGQSRLAGPVVGTLSSPGVFKYTFNIPASDTSSIPRGQAADIEVRGDVASSISGGAVHGTTYQFKINSASDISAYSVSAGRTISSNDMSVVSAIGNRITTLAGKLKVSARTIGAISGRPAAVVDDIANIVFDAHPASDIALQNLKITFSGAALNRGATGFAVALIDPLTGTNWGGSTAPSVCSPIGGTLGGNICVASFNLGINNTTIPRGTSKTIKLRIDSSGLFNQPQTGSTLSASFASANDVVWSVPGHGDGVNEVTVFPLTISTLSYFGSGTSSNAPVITAFTPLRWQYGTPVTLRGSGFTSSNILRFEGRLLAGDAGSYSSPDGQTITFAIPASGRIDGRPLLSPGEYQVWIENENGRSNTITVALFSSATPPSGTVEQLEFTRNLSCRSGVPGYDNTDTEANNRAVTRLQELLARYQCYSGSVTGVYDRSTSDAVYRCQLRFGLPREQANGCYVGAQTRSLLNDVVRRDAEQEARGTAPQVVVVSPNPLRLGERMAIVGGGFTPTDNTITAYLPAVSGEQSRQVVVRGVPSVQEGGWIWLQIPANGIVNGVQLVPGEYFLTVSNANGASTPARFTLDAGVSGASRGGTPPPPPPVPGGGGIGPFPPGAPPNFIPQINAVNPSPATLGSTITIHGFSFTQTNNTLTVIFPPGPTGTSTQIEIPGLRAVNNVITLQIPANGVLSNYLGGLDLVEGVYGLAVSNDGGSSLIYPYFSITLPDEDPGAATGEFTRNIVFGQRGAEVMRMQRFLAQYDCYVGPVNGVYDAGTARGVLSCQNTYGIPEERRSGQIFGAASRRVANQIIQAQRTPRIFPTPPIPVTIPPPATSGVTQGPPYLSELQTSAVVPGSNYVEYSFNGLNFQPGAMILYGTTSTLSGAESRLETRFASDRQIIVPNLRIPATFVEGTYWVRVQNPDRQVSNARPLIVSRGATQPAVLGSQVRLGGTAQVVGATFSRARSANDDIALLTFAGDTSADITVHSIGFTFQGTALSGATLSIRLIDPVTGTDWNNLPVGTCPGSLTSSGCTTVFAFGNRPIIRAGETKQIKLRIESSSFAGGQRYPNASLSANIRFPEELIWSYNGGIRGVNNPVAFPFTIANISYDSGGSGIAPTSITPGGGTSLSFARIYPDQVAPGAQTTLTLLGSGFVQNAVLLYSTAGTPVGSEPSLRTEYVSDRQLTISNLTIPADFREGVYSVAVKNPNGARSDTLPLVVSRSAVSQPSTPPTTPSGSTPTPGTPPVPTTIPTLSSVDQPTVVANQPNTVLRFFGSGFSPSSTIYYEGAYTNNLPATYVSSYEVQLAFPNGIPAGTYRAWVRANGIQSPQYVTVTAQSPTPTTAPVPTTPATSPSSAPTTSAPSAAAPRLDGVSLSPSSPQQNQAFTATISGSGFQPGVVLVYSGTSYPVTFNNSSVLAFSSGGLAAGSHSFWVRNPDQQTSNSLTVTIAAPTVTYVWNISGSGCRLAAGQSTCAATVYWTGSPSAAVYYSGSMVCGPASSGSCSFNLPQGTYTGELRDTSTGTVMRTITLTVEAPSVTIRNDAAVAGALGILQGALMDLKQLFRVGQ